MSDHFRALVVCTGNICRSAQAEQLILARIAASFPNLSSMIVVESAGTGAMVGSGMPDEAAELSTQYGGDPTNHSARQLTIAQVREADVVLTMSSEHRGAVARLLPRASRYTFTLTEFAALLESAANNHPAHNVDFSTLAPADQLRNAIKWVSARRGFLPPEDAKPVDVVDPYRRSSETYKRSALQIVESLDRAERAAVSLAQRVGA